MLTHLFNAATCARCRLCCNFRPASVWETPYLEEALCEQLTSLGIPLCTRADGSRSFALSFRTDSPDETADCPLLDPARGCTLPRGARPFECRVWPLRLMYAESGELCIGCYTACPALAEPSVRERLVAYASGELLPLLLDYARRFPRSVRPLHPAYAVIHRVDSSRSGASI